MHDRVETLTGSTTVQLEAYVMSSMFAFLSMITQLAMPDHACSMTHHTDSMIACAWFNSKAQNPHESP